MLRPTRFRPFEKVILWGIGLLLLGGGVLGFAFGYERANWKLAAAAAGLLVIALIYLVAAKRGKPL